MKIVMAGTRGVPAQYGGFETAIEEVGSRLVARGHLVTVMCRNPGQTQTEHKGMELVNGRSIRRKSLETLSHSFFSLPAIIRARPDAVIFFNAANAIPALFLKLFGIRYAIHVDGLEWKRSKWGRVGRTFYRFSEWLSVHSSRWLIADATGIRRYYQERFGKSTELISYGAPTTSGVDSASNVFSLDPGSYYLVVARLEPENNVHLILDAYSRQERPHPIVVVGGAPYGNEYLAGLQSITARSLMVGAVYDQAELDWLYANARAYIHGHSVGGTNPSLLRGGAVGVPVIAFDTEFNAEVLGATGYRFADADSLAQTLDELDTADGAELDKLGRLTSARIRENYNWEDVTSEYERLCRAIADMSSY